MSWTLFSFISFISFYHTKKHFGVELTQTFLLIILTFLLFDVVLSVLLLDQAALEALQVALSAFLSGFVPKILLGDQWGLYLLWFGTYRIFLDDHYWEGKVLGRLLNDRSSMYHVRFYEVCHLLPLFFLILNVHPGAIVRVLQVVLFSFLEESLL